MGGCRSMGKRAGEEEGEMTNAELDAIAAMPEGALDDHGSG